MISIQQIPYNHELEGQIYNRFKAHAEEAIGHPEFGNLIAFKAEDQHEVFLGVLIIRTLFGGLHIRHLVVEPNMRRQGIGKKLMEQAFDYGIKNGCSFVFLETLSFQALGFYLKLGFHIDFTRKGYNHGVTFHYLSRSLS